MHWTPYQLDQLQKQDKQVMRQFYGWVYPLLSSYFERRVNGFEDSQDLIQDTILAVLDSLPEFKYECSFKTWVYRIAHHELVDFYRKQKVKRAIFSRLPFLKDIIDKALGPQLRYEEVEVKQQIFKTLNILTEGYAEVLRLRYIEELSVAAIAEQLDVSYKTVESRLSRARLAFQKVYIHVYARPPV